VLRVVSRLRERGHQAYLVGGCVRDLLLDRIPKDFDVATSAVPDQVVDSFRKVIPTGIQHGTVTVLAEGTPVEVTTFRSEGVYRDGRRPSEVRFETDLTLDLSRRDFTINAMAYDPVANELRDPFDGRRDLRDRRVRTVGHPHERFSEDGLRPLRAVRFATVLEFEIQSETAAAIGATLEVFRKVAAERIREEFNKVLLSPRAAWGVTALAEVGLLTVFLPEAGAPPSADLLAALPQGEPSAALRLATLLARTAPSREGGDPRLGFPLADPGAGKAALERLKYPRQTIDETCILLEHHLAYQAPSLTDSQLRRLASRVGLRRVPWIIQLCTAMEKSRSWDRSLSRVASWSGRLDHLFASPPPLKVEQLALNGAAAMRILGVGPSPAVGEGLRFLMDEVLEDPTLNTEAQLEEKLRTWWRSRGP